MKIILVSPDLMAASQIMRAVEAVNGKFRQVGTVAGAVECLNEDNSESGDADHHVVLLDLSSKGTEVADSVTTLRQVAKPPTIIAYAPHVHVERLDAAREAGCDYVLSRGQVYRELADLLQQLPA